MTRIVYFLLSYFIYFAHAHSDSLVIEISSGLIEGQYVHSSAINKSYYSFRGIPYAEPPLGELRFRPPVPSKPWNQVLETKIDGPYCMQKGGGNEDCLFLNVYTPNLPNNEETDELQLLPVMVFIHGGGFQAGSSNSEYYGPDYLINKNIVLVSINYRVNIFGFLNAVEESAPGNVGLKDQVAGLQWVQENIAKFNGDPKKVTLFGQSAGSASVQYHLQSKLSIGLFHRAILQSGSTLNDWAFEENPIEVIHKLSNVLKMNSTNITEIVNDLRHIPAKELLEASEDESLLDTKHRIYRYRYIPSIEYDSPNAFVVESSYALLEANQINPVPVIVGHVSNEALIILGDPSINIDDYKNNPLLLVTKSLNIANDIETEKFVVNKIDEQYFKNDSMPFNLLFVCFMSDNILVRGCRKSVEFLREYKNSKIFFYIFDYKNIKDNLPGVSHGSELKYIFYTGATENKKEKRVRRKMTTLWTNFAKTGNPTPKKERVLNNLTWPSVLKPTEDLQYLYIGKHLEIRENPSKDNYNFWEYVFKTYGKPPFFIY